MRSGRQLALFSFILRTKIAFFPWLRILREQLARPIINIGVSAERAVPPKRFNTFVARVPSVFSFQVAGYGGGERRQDVAIEAVVVNMSTRCRTVGDALLSSAEPDYLLAIQ